MTANAVVKAPQGPGLVQDQMGALAVSIVDDHVEHRR